MISSAFFVRFSKREAIKSFISRDQPCEFRDLTQFFRCETPTNFLIQGCS